MTVPIPYYDIGKHKHNYAKWCAATAFRRGLQNATNDKAFKLIEASGLARVTGPEHIGHDVDEWQMSFMSEITAEATNLGLGEFKFGRAQKLVNVYLKTVLVCGGHHQHPNVAMLHPPLDEKLLAGLRSYLFAHRATHGEARSKFLTARRQNSRWTEFSRDDYWAHIAAIKALMSGKPLYMVEQHWNP